MYGKFICKVLIVDPDRTSVLNIRNLFSKRKVFGTVGFFVDHESNLERAHSRLQNEQWNIVFFEADYPGHKPGAGIDFLVDFLQSANSCPSVLLTGRNDLTIPARLLQLFQSGQVRFLPKNNLSWELIQESIADYFPSYVSLLIIDDDPDDQELLSARIGELLQRCGGYTIDTAGDPMEAHHKMAISRYDLAVLDRCLGPDASGFDLLPALRRNNENMGIILCTGVDPTVLTSDEVRMISHGKIKFVHKNALLDEDAADLIFSVTGILRWDQLRQKPM